MIALQETAAPPSDEELLAQLKAPLKKLVEEEINAEVDPEKLQIYWNCRRNWLLWRGIQYFAPVFNQQTGYTDFQAVNGLGDSGGNSYDYVQNIFRGFGRKFIAVLGQRSPNVKSVADDPDDEKSIRATRSADTCNGILNAWWNVDQRNSEITEKLWIFGPAYIYTPWNADGILYGWRTEPVMEPVPTPMGEAHYHCQQCGADSPAPTPQGLCPQCGAPLNDASKVEPQSVDVPTPTRTEKYPNGRVECHIADSLRVTTPFYTRSLETCPWLKYEYEENKSVLLAAYPVLRKKGVSDMDGDGDSANGSTARLSRDTTISPLGVSLRRAPTRWTFTRIWLQPWMYESVGAREEEDNEFRDLLRKNYPTGVRITKVQDEMVELKEEKLDELWSVVQPETGETINLDPIGQDMVPVQLLKNHTINIGAETIERGVPVTLADPRVIDFQQWNRKAALPAEVIPALPAVGDSLGDSMFSLPAAAFSQQMQPWIDGVVSENTAIVGIQPEIWGGGDPAPTAREAEIRKNAALAQLGTTWMFIRKGWEKAKLNGVRQLAKYGPGIVREGQLMVDLSELTEGGWHFEADEAIPATWGQMRDLVMFMMEKPPAVLEAWGFNRPENISRNKALLGMNGYYTPGEDDAQKVQDTIQKLLKEKVTQPPPAPPAPGAPPAPPPDPKPSIEPDAFEDNAQLVVQLIQGWCQSKAGRKEKEQNLPGYQNVVAYGKAYFALANPAPPPIPPAPPKLSVTAAIDKLPPNQADALLSDFKLQVPPTPPTPMNLPHGAAAQLVEKVQEHKATPPHPQPPPMMPPPPPNGAPALPIQ
jgi:hypothetical protein